MKKRCGHLHAGENGTSTPLRRNAFRTITVWTRLPTAHTSCKVWPWKGSRKQMRKNHRRRETDRERQNLIARAQYPPTPVPGPQFFVELRVSGLSWFFVDRRRVAWRTSRCYGHHSSGWASKGPLLQGPPRQRKSIEIRTKGEGTLSCACGQKKRDMNKVQFRGFLYFY